MTHSSVILKSRNAEFEGGKGIFQRYLIILWLHKGQVVLFVLFCL